MYWHAHALVAAIAVPLAAGFAASMAKAQDTMRISGPIVHENLSVYFIHGASAPGPVPLTLKEALAAGRVNVHETGHVNELTIENTGAEEVFVQAGDIVKGGQQDRVLTVSFIVPPKSGKVPIGAFCVEQGRWSARGMEDVRKFASAEKAVPSREAKLAMMAPAKPAPPPAAAPAAGIDAGIAAAARRTQTLAAAGAVSETSARQSFVWDSVAAAQRKLSGVLGDSVRSAQSASSLQLSLENKKLEERRQAYVAKVKPAGEAGSDIVGYVFAVNGKLNSGDVYPSHGLFAKMWPKLAEAAATEAIAEKAAAQGDGTVPSTDDVRAFIARAEAGNANLSKIDGQLVRESRDADTALFLETRKAGGGFVHRAYLAR